MLKEGKQLRFLLTDFIIGNSIIRSKCGGCATVCAIFV